MSFCMYAVKLKERELTNKSMLLYQEGSALELATDRI